MKYLLPWKGNRTWYIAFVGTALLWCCYVAVFAQEAIFKSNSGMGDVTFGLTKVCLTSASQKYIPQGCYAYESSYGKWLSDNCDIRDNAGQSVNFCPKRKAGAAMGFIGLLLMVVSLGGTGLVLANHRPELMKKVAIWPQWGSLLCSFLALCVLGSITSDYEVGDLPGDPQWNYGISYKLLLAIFFVGMLTTMVFYHAVFQSKHIVKVSAARRLSDIGRLSMTS